jgi:hypothetical protein
MILLLSTPCTVFAPVLGPTHCFQDFPAAAWPAADGSDWSSCLEAFKHLDQEPALRMLLMHPTDAPATSSSSGGPSSKSSSDVSGSSSNNGGSSRGTELPAAPAAAASAGGVACRLFPRQLEYVLQKQQQQQQQDERGKDGLFGLYNQGQGARSWSRYGESKAAALDVLRFTDWGMASSAWGLTAAQQQRLSSQGELVVTASTQNLEALDTAKERKAAREQFEERCKKRAELLLKVRGWRTLPLGFRVEP